MSFWTKFPAALADGVKWLGNKVGSFWNNITGKTELLEKEQSFNSAEAQKNREFQQQEAETLRTFNSAEAQKNRDWQEDMSNSAHQRSVADMKSAGLNPILSAGGSGASTPSGSTASGSLPGGSAASSSGGSPSGNPIRAIADVISSAASLTNNKNVDKSTTQQIYNSAGSLLKTVETWTRN